jgi:signal transduction histidine kinase
MDKLLDDLLEYARIGRSNGKRYAETTAGDKLMDNILEMLSPAGFTVAVSPSFAGIQVPVMPLQQILMNLISNAIKHHDKENGCIEVTVESRGERYVFAVKDDGPGIPAKFHEQIFKMFQTIKPRDQVEGSGMGLAMVRKHVELFGGTIAVESEGRGSTFRFTWPQLQNRSPFPAESVF